MATVNEPDLRALAALKAASLFIRSPDGSTGSGYLLAPGIAGTANHVVLSWSEGVAYDVLVGYGPARKATKARLLKRDVKADAAVLAVDGVADVAPLPVAAPLERRAAWEGYGFPGVAIKSDKPEGLSISGHVQDPAHFDNEQAVVVLYSEAIAAGNASPLHGFSGSPVLVDGALVGHLIRHIGDPEDRKRAAFGYAFACPIAQVTALLDQPPAPQVIAPEPLPTVRQSVAATAPIAADEYHVFISYRSSDRPWALSLVARLEGAGLKVFIDQKELEPGQYLAAQLGGAMKRSRAAVVLVSRGWLDSPWCQQEANVLVQRAVEEAAFTLVPLRLDKSDMPLLLNSRLWIDFSDRPRAEGSDLDRLIDQLLHRAAGTADTPQARAAAAERKVTDEFVARVRTAALGPAAGVLAELADWRKTRSDDVAPLIAAAEALIGKTLFEEALGVLAAAPVSLRVRQLTAFAKRKAGRVDEALQEFEALKREGNLDPETAGLLAGTYKKRWQDTGDVAFRQLAYQTYREANERAGDAFNGINAASMALHCGDKGKSNEFAARVIEQLGKRPPEKLDHWDQASLGEAYLLNDKAHEWYAKAAAAAAGRHQDIAVMRRQARLNLEALGLPRDRLDAALPVPRVLAYCGHRVDAPGRTPPRFPSSKVPAVRQAIRDKLSGLGTLHGFGGAASGTDLLVLGELAAKSLTATVVLPFPAEDFAAESVGGGVWRQIFDELRGKPGIEFVEPPLRPVKPAPEALGQAFYDANREVQRRAMEYARRLDEKPVVLVVWDGQPGDGPGGTADTVELWRFQGVEPVIIDLRVI